MSDDRRVEFDFEVDFSNGGGLQGQGFRLDIDGEDISDRELADYIVADLRLLMVGEVRIRNKRILHEAHKRPRKSPAQRAAGPRLVDLAHTVTTGQTVYPGLPAAQVSDFLSHEESRARYAPGVTFQIGRVNMVANTGTAIDSPFHRFADRADIAALPLSSIADLDGVVARLTGAGARAVTREALAALDVAGKAVLIETGWSSRWGTPDYFAGHPYLTGEGAAWLRDHGAALVGIDSLNIDDTGDAERPAHSILLEAGIPIVENLASLAQLPPAGFRFSAVPMRLQGMGAFPVRAWARIAG